MNTIRTLFVVAALAAVGCWVYVAVNGRPDQPDEDAAPDGYTPAQVQLPGSGPGTSPPTTTSSVDGVAPVYAPLGSTAPQNTPPATSGQTAFGGNAAPPFVATGSAAPEFTPPPAPAYTSPNNQQTPPGPTAPGATHLADQGQVPSALRVIPPPRPNTSSGSSLPPANPGMAGQAEGGVTSGFDAFMNGVRSKLDEGRLAEAHLTLSSRYDDPQLSPEQSRQVLDLLGQLAGTVIYSREHWLEPAYTVQAGDTPEQIAQRYDVPWGLLANINGIGEGQPLEPGLQLKVVRGPFKAVVNLQKHELTLMLQGRYAGRFPIGLGVDHPNLTDRYIVSRKTENPAYYAGPTQVADGGAANNPLGSRWIGLDDKLGIHGTNDPRSIGSTSGPGCIRLGARDIEDLYDILSPNRSQVVIRR